MFKPNISFLTNFPLKYENIPFSNTEILWLYLQVFFWQVIPLYSWNLSNSVNSTPTMILKLSLFYLHFSKFSLSFNSNHFNYSLTGFSATHVDAEVKRNRWPWKWLLRRNISAWLCAELGNGSQTVHITVSRICMWGGKKW